MTRLIAERITGIFAAPAQPEKTANHASYIARRLHIIRHQGEP